MSAKEGMMVGKYTQSQTDVISGGSKQELTADSGIDHWVASFTKRRSISPYEAKRL